MPTAIGIGISPMFQLGAVLNYNAATFGFLPTATGSENTAAWNSIPGGKIVSITTPGEYEIDGTLWEKSNTRYQFVPGCTIKKTGTASTYTHVFANDAITEGGRNENISLFGNGLTIKVNGKNVSTASDSYRMRGVINHYKVDGLEIDGIYNDDNSGSLFFSHSADITNFKFTNIICKGEKDGLHFNGKCYHGELTDIETDTSDDSIAFLGGDYYTNSPCVGNIEDVTVTNWKHRTDINNGGNGCRLICMSWAQWLTATSYKYSEPCVNAGKIYIKSSAGSQTSSVAPTHSTGIVTGADGIAWTFIQVGTETEANIDGITFKNLDHAGVENVIKCDYTNSNDMIAASPGTEGNAFIDNIVIDNIIWVPVTTVFLIENSSFVKTFTIKNTTLSPETNYSLIYCANTEVQGNLDNLIFDNCHIVMDGGYVVYCDAGITLGIIDLINGTTIESNVSVFSIRNTTHFDVNLGDTEFTGILGLFNSTSSVNVDVDAQTATFTNPQYILRKQAVFGTINFISTGATFTDPTGSYLFYGSYTGIVLDISGSIGNVTFTKIADPTINVVACDLYSAEPDAANSIRYNFMNAATVTKDGSNRISIVTDTNEGAVSLIQPSDNLKFVLELEADGALADGSNDYMEALIAKSQPFTVYLVLKQITWTLFDNFFNGLNCAILQGSNTPNIYAYAGGSSSQNTNLALNTFGIVRLTANGASSSLQVNKTAPITGNFGADGMLKFILAANSIYAGNANLKLKDVIIKDGADNEAMYTAYYNYLKLEHSL